MVPTFESKDGRAMGTLYSGGAKIYVLSLRAGASEVSDHLLILMIGYPLSNTSGEVSSIAFRSCDKTLPFELYTSFGSSTLP